MLDSQKAHHYTCGNYFQIIDTEFNTSGFITPNEVYNWYLLFSYSKFRERDFAMPSIFTFLLLEFGYITTTEFIFRTKYYKYIIKSQLIPTKHITLLKFTIHQMRIKITLFRFYDPGRLVLMLSDNDCNIIYKSNQFQHLVCHV